MKLFTIKSGEKELYFQLEKTKEGLKILDTIAQILFGDTEFFFDMEWQSGLPKRESYLGHESKGIFAGAIVSEKRIHLLIRGLKDKNKIEKIRTLILEQYEVIRPSAGD